MMRLASVSFVMSVALFVLTNVPAFAQDIIGWVPVYERYPNEDFTGIWGSAGNDIFAVGSSGLVMHFDGTSWQYSDAETSADLKGVWGLDATHVYAFGRGVILQFDGQTWRNMFEGYLTTGETFYGVWGANASELWAVSSNGYIWRFDGTRWSVPVFAAPDRYDFWSIWGTSADNIYVGGWLQPVFHYDGVEWKAVSIKTMENPEGRWDVHDIWGSGPDDIYVGKLHFDGLTWNVLNETTGKGLWGSGASDVFSVAFVNPGDSYAAIQHFDGNSWRTTSGGISKSVSGIPYELTDIWGSDRNNVYAVGKGGKIVRGPRFDVHIKFGGSGTGEVAAENTNLVCKSDCVASFDRGINLSLNALPAINSNFDVWSGDCAGIGTCGTTVESVRVITAVFSIKTFQLVVSVNGSGLGHVLQTNSGTTGVINCGTLCSDTFQYGETVALEAQPEVRSFLKGWSGDCSGVSTCNLYMISDKNVAATFDELRMEFLPLIKRIR